jgi:transposase
MLPSAVRIYIATAPADMRRSFDSLAGMTREVLGQDPLSGHLFVFRNRNGDRVKILAWDRSGFVLWYKRLERGTFRFPAPVTGTIELDAAELTLILEGIDLANAQRQKRFALPSRPATS